MADDKKVIFSMVGVSKIYPPQKQVLKDIYLSFFYGAKIGIIGLNGAGKSTLLKIIAGIDKQYQGEVVFSPGYSVGYLEQDPKLDPSKTVKEIVQEGVQPVLDLLKEFDQVNESFADPDVLEDPDKMDKLINRQAELQDKLDAADAWNIDNKLERAMDALRCPPEDQNVATLSGGERRRVALCRLLLQNPDILLLDEPTNHLDAESIDWLEQHLQQYPGTVICITHDRYFLDHVAGWILELDRGEGIPWKGNYSSWLDQKTKRMAQEEKQASKRRKTLERELEWIRMAPKARQAKGKARLSSYDRLLNEDQKEREEKLEIFIPNGPRLGNKVIEAQHVAKAFGDKVLFDDLNFMLPPNGIVGVIGPNGAGKSTTMNIMTGYIASTSGEVLIDGHNILEEPEAAKKCIGYLPEQPPLYFDMTVAEYLKFAAELKKVPKNERETQIEQVMELTGITAMANRLIKNLSKGYKQRVGLAQAILGYPEIIILDEPTVGLDPKQIIEIRELIRKLSEEHTIILSSHILSEVSAVCDYIMIINHGKLVASDTTENLMNHSLGSNTLELTVKGEKQDVEKMLRDVEEIQKLEWKPGENEKTVSMVITTEEKTDIREKLFYMMAEAKMPILNMQFTKVSLEDIFLELTQNETAPVPDEQDTKPESAPEDETGTYTEKENDTEQEAHDESNL